MSTAILPSSFELSDGDLQKMNIVAAADPCLSELTTRLGNGEHATETLPAPSGEAGPFASYEDFTARGLKNIDRPVRIYSGHGLPTKIIVPEDYAQHLDEVRKLRLRGSESGVCQEPADDGESVSVEDARCRLAQHELRNRLLPEELLPLLDELPDCSYFGTLFLLAETNPEDIWVQQDYNSSFVSAMATLPDGRTMLFRSEHNEFLRLNLFHEWSHRLQHHCQEESAAFSDALELEWRQYVPNTYALRSYGEHWAVIGEELTHRSAHRFLTLAEKAPLRTVVWLVALAKALAASRHACREQAAYNQRVQFARQHVAPAARAALAGIDSAADSTAQERARRLQAFLDKALSA